MLQGVRKVLKNAISEEKFFCRVEQFLTDDSEEYLLIERMYRDAERRFTPQLHVKKEDYLLHIRGVALIVLDYLKILERKKLPISGYLIVVASVGHSIVTNSEGLYSLTQLGRDYGCDIKRIVDCTSRRSIQEFSNSENSAKNRFQGRLHQDNIDIDVIVVLLSDVLHNHIVKWPRFTKRVKQKIYDTWNFYYPLAIAWGILVYELDEATKILAKDYTK